MRRAVGAAIRQKGDRLAALEQFLAALSYRSVLGRGFALVRDQAGAPMRSAAAIGPGQRLRIEFADGEVAATARDGSPAPMGTRRGAAKGERGGQGSLF